MQSYYWTIIVESPELLLAVQKTHHIRCKCNFSELFLSRIITVMEKSNLVDPIFVLLLIHMSNCTPNNSKKSGSGFCHTLKSNIFPFALPHPL